jgi:indolepyruvate ferredoxin oxidoreductase
MNNITPLRAVSLSDKYDLEKGRLFITGTQALTRLPLIQKKLDEASGLNTGGFISGYRGSPLGAFDAALWQEKNRLDENGIVFTPGVNEDLAATAVWGTQQLNNFPNPIVEGVFSIWYGKGPGVDRSYDVFRHGNYAGSHKNGGVLLVYGDDHPGKSSTVAHQSEYGLAAVQIPTLYPANVKEILEYGLLGWAMSRYSGLWTGLKCVNETVEQTQTVDIDISNWRVETPDRGASEDLANMQKAAFAPIQQEILLKRHRIPLLHKFIRANGIDRQEFEGEGGLGIVTTGKSYEDVLQAFSLMGLDGDTAKKMGVALYKVGCIWPVEPEGLKEFAKGRSELLFVEEKCGIIEEQAATILYNLETRPVLTGKKDEHGELQFISDMQVPPKDIAEVIRKRLSALGHGSIVDRLAGHNSGTQDSTALMASGLGSTMRMPYFCSGCPHNTSTKVPEGSLAMAGIGCHAMALFNRKDTLPPTQMGGEGINWTGVAPFSNTKHMFQNLGDGTYFHSGLLAIRASIAAKVNITYKILYNDAVAMTGGQPIDGTLSVGDMAAQVVAEGVKTCVIVTDNTDHYKGSNDLPAGMKVYHRDDLDHVQKTLRDVEGCSVLIYEQTCAAEKRRRRKRGKFPNPAKRMFIYDEVCEGCGDCSVQSTCVSIQPIETELGTKRTIDQSSCNKDYSCVNGFCPSFVTVLGAEPKKAQGIELDNASNFDLPDPEIMALKHASANIMIAGIGGTGVITVGAVLGMAAHLEGKACSIYDMTGLSQKNGSVYSHLRIAENIDDIAAQRIGAGEADVVMGFDLVAASSGDAAPTYSADRTKVIGNIAVSPTAQFQFNRDACVNKENITGNIAGLVGADNAYFIDATNMALKLSGNTIAANMFLVGYALQKGLLPLSLSSIERAIEINGIAIPFNKKALLQGRIYAHSPETIEKAVSGVDEEKFAETLDDVLRLRHSHLTDYQNKAYADGFKATVEGVKKAVENLGTKGDNLVITITKQLAKLMTYKDEYEVARLYSQPEFLKKLEDQFERGFKLKFNMAPPLLARRDRYTGLPKKGEYGPWVFSVYKILAKMKGLRGSAFDIFGKTKERKMERALITEYRQLIDDVLASLTKDNIDDAVALLSMVEEVRGFGHIKMKAVEAYRTVVYENLEKYNG